MSTQRFMWPFSLFAPGNLNQPILPGWSFGNVSVSYAGNAEIEKDVVEKVASYGKQLGIITDVVLELAGDKPPEGEQPLAQLRDIAAKVGKVKEEATHVGPSHERRTYDAKPTDGGHRNRGIDNPRDTSKMTMNDLERALQEHLAGKPVSTPMTNPIGCNVKWEGQDAHWMPEDACDLV